jgi:hypothetical protein
MICTTRIFAFSLFTSMMVMAFAGPSLAADSCDLVFNAMTKAATTPSHRYSTHTMPSPNGNKTTEAETIYLQNKIYIRTSGKWMESHESPSEMLQQLQENRNDSKPTCQFVRNESVNNESAALYSLRSENEDVKEDGQIWISTHSGLTLREEVDMDTGDSEGKSHISIRYEYSNVKPPM